MTLISKHIMASEDTSDKHRRTQFWILGSVQWLTCVDCHIRQFKDVEPLVKAFPQDCSFTHGTITGFPYQAILAKVTLNIDVNKLVDNNNIGIWIALSLKIENM